MSIKAENEESKVLTTARILEAAEETLRRYGPAKTTVVDVARALGVSHGTVYRHFATKADLRAAVVWRWLEQSLPPLSAIAEDSGSPVDRLRQWLDYLAATKRRRASADPELFAAYYALALETDEVVRNYLLELKGQIALIVSDGVKQGLFTSDDPLLTAQSIMDATVKFHNPGHASSWVDPNIEDAFERVWQLILRGISAPEPRS